MSNGKSVAFDWSLLCAQQPTLHSLVWLSGTPPPEGLSLLLILEATKFSKLVSSPFPPNSRQIWSLIALLRTSDRPWSKKTKKMDCNNDAVVRHIDRMSKKIYPFLVFKLTNRRLSRKIEYRMLKTNFLIFPNRSLIGKRQLIPANLSARRWA